MAKIYRIHPSIGVARLGNSEGNVLDVNFYHGPETPGVVSMPADGRRRDAAGFLRRQGARFRIFEFDDVDATVPPREVLLGAEFSDIEWTVHLANKKAFWHEFNGTAGEDGNYLPDTLRNGEDSDPVALRRSKYAIDFGPRTLSGASQSLAFSKEAGSGFQESFPGPLNNGEANVEITTLGSIQTDAQGRLTVLGGHGIAGTRAPAVHLPDYANNREWFDDTSDGPVEARITLADGTTRDVVPAWVIVGPPDYAPFVESVVTLYDAVYDVAVRRLGHDPTLFSGGTFLDTYEPSFSREIYPILKRATAEAEVQKIAINHHQWNYQALSANPFVPTEGVLAPGDIFDMLRPPTAGGNGIFDGLMPKLLGDDGAATALTLTPTQYHLMKQWRAGRFRNDWNGAPPPPDNAFTPAGLDRAALESCVGGGFFPGIEAGWIMRRAEIYQAPFRFHAQEPSGDEAVFGRLTPGSVTMRSAVPWQADFFDCQQHWWPAQRPDQVREKPGSEKRVEWHRGVSGGSDEAQHLKMVWRWSKLGVLERDASGVLFENERTL
jgi:hypothetical protein